MKKSLLRFSIFFLLSVAVIAPFQAQETTTSPSFSLSEIPQVAVEARVSIPMPTKAMDGFTEVPQMPFSQEGKIGQLENIQTRALVVQRQIIGLTQYDLQTNAAIDDRLVGSGSAVSAGWNMSLETGTFPDRGTGYNFFDGEVCVFGCIAHVTAAGHIYTAANTGLVYSRQHRLATLFNGTQITLQAQNSTAQSLCSSGVLGV